ncbi:MAG: 4-alpha-glucanotransferase [Chloroflexi bacterium CFX4]|nr:4-alpha-glucanotransferase [Chloroflexi bacterium CFX4]MDL1922901.1 4-alpha-glucanotransferase [Chloroflexi bacterium CFX3]
MRFQRASGILLHPTSLPGRYGIGDLGASAYRFVDYLVSAEQSLWQILPLGPTIIYDSPYQTLSAFAGNPNLISLDKLVESGWLEAHDLADVPHFPEHTVPFGEVIPYHEQKLDLAFTRFQQRADATTKAAFEDWCARNGMWLYDFALFATLKGQHGGVEWVKWSREAAQPSPARRVALREQYRDQVENHMFRQWLFYTQWAALKAYANGKGVQLIGDLPIFVSHDSADVWANPHLFELDPNTGQSTVVAGVPPDFFNPEDGQLWGNPHYNWRAMEEEGYAWWIARLRTTLETVDRVRIDHFRGFEAYWEIPASETTAKNGRWVKGPDAKLFEAFEAALGRLPIIAEDLGIITPEVTALRDRFDLPGMKVLQFAFGDDPYSVNAFLPHMYPRNSVVYTGTHDNNTTLGWWQTGEASEGMRRHLREYIGHEVQEPHWDLIRLGMNSVADTFIVPMQDVLGFGADARMNKPGFKGGYWTWRFAEKWLYDSSRERLLRHTQLSARTPAQQANLS